jgi:AcrR family transcriptional regulator
LRAAREVFSELGYDAATFQAIAIRADLTRPAINHYFANKRVLYNEVVEKTNEMLVAEGMTKAGVETALLKRLSAFFSAAMQVNSDNRSAAAFLTTSMLEAQRHAELGRNENSSLKAARALVSWALTEAIESGELTTDTDVPTLVETLVAVMLGMAFYAGYIGGHDELATIADKLELVLANELWRLAD